MQVRRARTKTGAFDGGAAAIEANSKQQAASSKQQTQENFVQVGLSLAVSLCRLAFEGFASKQGKIAILACSARIPLAHIQSC